MKKTFWLSGSILIIILLFSYFFKGGLILDHLGIYVERPFIADIQIPDNYATIDRNQNGIPDAMDIVHAARIEVEQHTRYKSSYYAGGYPPNDEGVCTDVIWRGLMGANIKLKDLMDQDISDHTDLYPRVDGVPDPNIDFRRVPNQAVYLERFAQSLTTKLIKGDKENLQEWQAGDIVIFLEKDFNHVGIISDKRAKDGTPYFIHNIQPFAAEVRLSSFTTPIAGHYRWKY
ncbi:DUF1287 domain-containing protein [Cytobacillus purgationiresistens]|uniref:Uncharacterized protein YijF (DUF1287 family) n=1 Tax=Cytobacillus purgationiresistens TaxID=863449 RepID=A0ABU0AQL5_9BACI|nr:DUF1287 domain-containing protein [Cytobacillus purgationiresistens]MDQ0273169.1 uncharacterized protein YijF (DUF1287 family) [Cytobacillus purgationiresistens]